MYCSISDEILKRKNITYAIVSLSQSIAMAYLLKKIVLISRGSWVALLLLWLFSLVLIGFSSKTFRIFSKLPFNQLIVQKNNAVAFSYMGFIWGWTLIIASSINHEIDDLKWYLAQVVLKILLSVIIFPIFKKGLLIIFKIQEDNQNNLGSSSSSTIEKIDEPEMEYGLYEGILTLSSCFLTTVITGQIHFGTFYPIF